MGKLEFEYAATSRSEDEILEEHVKRATKTVFDAVWLAGQPHGLKPMGMAALDMVRIEAGLAFAGHEFLIEAYQTAIKEKYKFFSYGDAMLIL